MTYSIDFRQRVIDLKSKKSLTDKKLANMFNVSSRTIIRWKKNILPCYRRNKPATKIDMDRLKENLKESPDLYHYERAKTFKVSKSAIGYAIKRLNITYKKKL